MSEPALLTEITTTVPRALVISGAQAALVSADGEIETLKLSQARGIAEKAPILLCHAKLLASRLGALPAHALDILELFAFVHPARFVVPTPKGLAQTLDLPVPEDAESEALTLWQARDVLLGELSDLDRDKAERAAAIAAQMAKGGWPWAGAVLQALGNPPHEQDNIKALASWSLLPEWEDIAPPEAGTGGITANDVRQRLADILNTSGHTEPRPEQSDYASALAAAFSTQGDTVLAEAGTGVGKTLGYLAPASLWAEQNNGPVWLSTYTRNLQRQIESETRRLYPDDREQVVIRKGRENYLCLLNYEEAVRGSFVNQQMLITVGLVARWLEATRDGDLKGGDMPGWLPDLIGRSRTYFMADRRGECLHGGCIHYKKCFIERSVRQARTAKLVIANHALLMSAAAAGGIDEAFPPSRFIFDEGHHLFHAADSAFGSDLSGAATYDLRRWLLGGEGRSKGRVRGLARRAEPVLPDGEAGSTLLEAIKQQAMILPGEGWLARLEEGEPRGVVEHFLLYLRQHVRSRNEDDHSYSLETDIGTPSPELLTRADKLRADLKDLAKSVTKLRKLILDRLEKEENLEGEVRRRIEPLGRTLQSYVIDQLEAWCSMLEGLHTQTPAEFVDWLGIERIDNRDIDVGFYRRWLDPTRPFAIAMQNQARGMVITSATLTDPGLDIDAAWKIAEAETGTMHLDKPAIRARVPSPFDYAKQTRVLVVTDVPQKDDAAVANAYRELFLASGGGALGLFTAIERLKRTHRALHGPLTAAHLPLYAQHVDGLDPHTLVDIFRAEGNACLLGTDAVRDGVDVPGRALRLIVFDRIPWPRTDLLLRARKAAMGGAEYSERLTRQKLRQAFGRLIRRADDHGVFVLLSPLPSRLASAFPGVTPERVTLAEAVSTVKSFLNPVDSRPLPPL